MLLGPVLVMWIAAQTATEPAPAPAASTPAAPAPAAAAPSAPSAPPEDVLLVLDVAGAAEEPAAQGLTPLLVTLVEERTEMKVTAASTVRDRLSLASEKIEAGCDAAACMAEVAGAIGARVVLFSRYSTVGEVKLLRLEAFDEREQRSVSVVTVRAASIGDVIQELPRATSDLVARSDGAIPPRQSASTVVDAPGFFDRPGNTVLVTGGALLAVGVASIAGFVAGGVAADLKEQELDQALLAYNDDPRNKTARAVLDARDAYDGQRGIQGLTNLLLLTGLGGLVGGGAALYAGIQMKEQAE